jgi:hypothetical protein
MSTRLRILFHCSLEGNLAHLGRGALKTMEKYALPAATSEPTWLSQEQWIAHKRPKFLRRKAIILNKPQGAVTFHYLVPGKPMPTEVGLKNQTLLERIKGLWTRIPMETRIHCNVIVSREARNSKWKHSPCRPFKYGWDLPSKRPNAKANKSALKNAPASIHANGAFTAPIIAAHGVPPGVPEDAHLHAWTVNAVDKAPKVNPLLESSLAELEGIWSKQAANAPLGSPKKAQKAQAQTKKPNDWYIGTEKAQPEPDWDSPAPSVPGVSEGEPQKPRKPKLRIGVWS